LLSLNAGDAERYLMLMIDGESPGLETNRS
jgi:hypothetical protein